MTESHVNSGRLHAFTQLPQLTAASARAVSPFPIVSPHNKIPLSEDSSESTARAIHRIPSPSQEVPSHSAAGTMDATAALKRNPEAGQTEARKRRATESPCRDVLEMEGDIGSDKDMIQERK